MNYSLAALLVSDSVKLIGCRFANQGKQTYHFKTVIQDLDVGDLVIVAMSDTVITDTGIAAIDSLKVVAVTELDAEADFDNDIRYKWIVARVPRDEVRAFPDLIAAETEAVKVVAKSQKAATRRALATALTETLGDDVKKLPTFGPERT